jgi:hypothetical protein
MIANIYKEEIRCHFKNNWQTYFVKIENYIEKTKKYN